MELHSLDIIVVGQRDCIFVQVVLKGGGGTNMHIIDVGEGNKCFFHADQAWKSYHARVAIGNTHTIHTHIASLVHNHTSL